MKRMLCMLCTAIVLTTALTVPAMAAEKSGSISITVTTPDIDADGRKETIWNGSTQEDAEAMIEEFRQLLIDENIPLIWDKDAKDGGFEPYIDVSRAGDHLEDFRNLANWLVNSGSTHIYCEAEPHMSFRDEWMIMVYR